MGLDDGPYGIGWWFQTFTSEMRWLNDPFLSIWNISKLLGFRVPGSCKWLTSTSLYAWRAFVHRSSLRESETYQFPTKISHYTAKISLKKTVEDWNLTQRMYKNGRNWSSLSSLQHSLIPHHNWGFRELLLMEKILHTWSIWVIG